MQRMSSALVCAFGVAMAIDWALALAHRFVSWALIAAAIVAVAAFAAPAAKIFRDVKNVRVAPGVVALVAVTLAPVATWIVFVLIRGALLFACDHDCLAYHMAKAVLITRDHGYAFFDGPSIVIGSYPANYELLVADVLALTGTDSLMEWVSTASFVALGVAAGGMAERWWGRGAHVLPAMLVAWGAPVVILHSGSHKNDILFSFAAIAAFSFVARWTATGEAAAGTVGLLAALLACGTKISGGFLVLAIVPLAVARVAAWRREGARAALGRAARATGVALLLAPLAGCIVYVLNLVHIHRPIGVEPFSGYGAWNQLWMFPVLLFARPFFGPASMWVPWKHAHWWWNTHDMYFSSLGLPTTLGLFALPYCCWRYRRTREDPQRRRERTLGAAAAALLFASLIPTYSHLHPEGFFEVLVRFFMFVPPVVASLTIAPVVREMLAASTGYRVMGIGLVLFCASGFAYSAYDYGLNDFETPLSVFLRAFERPDIDLSHEILPRPIHAGAWLDEHAGPHDRVAFDGGFDSWTYPLFGRAMSRDVVFLHPERANFEIPGDVDWVVVDQAWNIIFGHPDFVDFGVAEKYIFRGHPTARDRLVFELLAKDPRFSLVYYNRGFNQAVFRRDRTKEAR